MLIVAQLKERVGFAHFDARVFAVPSMSEALRNVWWRQNDCKCNSKLNLGAANLKQREFENLSPAQIVRKLRAEKGIDWRDMPGPYKWGACTLIRRPTTTTTPLTSPHVSPQEGQGAEGRLQPQDGRAHPRRRALGHHVRLLLNVRTPTVSCDSFTSCVTAPSRVSNLRGVRRLRDSRLLCVCFAYVRGRGENVG